MKLADALEVVHLPGGDYIRTMRCRLCGNVFYDIESVIDANVSLDGIMAQVSLHYSLFHDLKIRLQACDDTKCEFYSTKKSSK